MRVLRIGVTSLLVVGLSTSAFAGDLQASIAKAARQQAQTGHGPMPKGYVWAGGALFAGGIGAAFYGFLHNQHTGYPTYGEATATNVQLGSAGIVAATVGGTLLFLGQRKARSSPSLTFGPDRVTVSKQLSW